MMPPISRANYSDSSNKKSTGSTISTSTSTSNNKRSTYCRSKRKKIMEYGIIILVTLGIQHSLLLDEIGTATTNTTGHTNNNDNNFELEIRKKSSNIIYGHLHFPKTGGTNLNGRMAAAYDNVCGNKGYSYDAYQFNSRGRQHNITEVGDNNDSISAVSNSNHFDRGRVKEGIMKEIGYENCNYISQESVWNFWPTLIKDLNQKNKNNYNNNNNNNNSTVLTLELHVPCREPLQHLMSMASHFNKKYVCDEQERNITIPQAIDTVYMKQFGDSRFSTTLLLNGSNNNNIDLKCFNPFPLENYIHYMEDKLTSRRFPVLHYQQRTTNQQHEKATECIWETTSSDYKQKVIQLLIDDHPYMKFCSDCIGSNNELQLL